MEHNTPQKIKLLKIWEILNDKTDPQHQMTTQQLISELEKCDISCERRSIYRDIETLRLNGYEVLKGRSWHDNTYYVKERRFNISEIKIVMDAVQSAAFIPADKTDILIDKLAKLSSEHQAELLKRHTVHFITAKHNNSSIYDNVEIIENALENKVKIKFHYFHLNEYGEKVYAHDKKVYYEEPLGMILEDGNYYLLSYRDEDKYVNNVKVFRIDRIDHINVIEETICSDALNLWEQINNYRIQAFKMYGGDKRKVTFQFSADLMEVIYDKFGHNVRIRRSGDMCRATVLVQVSPTLWGWMLQFPTKMKIYEPKDLKHQYDEWVRSAL
ncbi:WYL domain-containing protein [uncultured Ruminococcus sp.]|uniref:helix-turn-helix transcriptional regulator n=1 Tax=uncultured Ruminococcus sp. TaxID=165186 RepID=UPI0025ECA181|nr:WYL domain-containing protein [uncultured Ruminococcus sp.]